ncbi:MAG: class I SAM-dependent methyltransferase [Candidatus Nealsonbacteria bacterium]
MTKWEKFFDEKIKEIAQQKIVFDIGGSKRFNKALSSYEKYFHNCDYKTIDIDSKCEPDILADAHNLPIADDSSDGVICKSTLEHTKNPIQVVEEIYRILKKGGKHFITAPFLTPYHGNDYWRFTEDGIKYLFRKFSKMEFCPTTHCFESVFTFLKAPFLGRLLDKITIKYQSGKQVGGYFIFLIK